MNEKTSFLLLITLILSILTSCVDTSGTRNLYGVSSSKSIQNAPETVETNVETPTTGLDEKRMAPDFKIDF